MNGVDKGNLQVVMDVEMIMENFPTIRIRPTVRTYLQVAIIV